jgi:hypothetical protein
MIKVTIDHLKNVFTPQIIFNARNVKFFKKMRAPRVDEKQKFGIWKILVSGISDFSKKVSRAHFFFAHGMKNKKSEIL